MHHAPPKCPLTSFGLTEKLVVAILAQSGMSHSGNWGLRNIFGSMCAYRGSSVGMPLPISGVVEQYQSIDDTIVQLFVSQASVVMIAKTKIHSKSSQPGVGERALMVLTSHDVLGNTGRKTGFWLEEFADPYLFRDAGVELTLASPKGGEPPLDPKSDLPENQMPSVTRFKKDAAPQKALSNTAKVADVRAQDYDTVVYPGGHGPIAEAH